ncbi:MAG: hypothetical protein ACFFBP_02225 [Promethearchaeota archaeon]
MTDELNNYDNTVKKISRVILTHQQKMIREKDLLNLCGATLDFDQIMGDIYSFLKNVGFDLIKTSFQEQKYYVLIAEGKDDDITPSQYGTLALILALSKEIDENMKISDLKEIFSEVWTTDVKTLIEKDYLREFEDLDIIKVTPLTKATFYTIFQDLNLQNLIDIFKNT